MKVKTLPQGCTKTEFSVPETLIECDKLNCYNCAVFIEGTLQSRYFASNFEKDTCWTRRKLTTRSFATPMNTILPTEQQQYEQKRLDRATTHNNTAHDNSKLGKVATLLQKYDNVEKDGDIWVEEFYEAIYEVVVHNTKIGDMDLKHAREVDTTNDIYERQMHETEAGIVDHVGTMI